MKNDALLESLNPEQLAAVTLPAESALILAGAGSGKTRVLTTRMAWLMQTHQAHASQLLAVTFTNKAAKEMLTRLANLLPFNVQGVWVGTFHGLCNRLLRMHFRDANLPQTFQILDMQDQLASIKRLFKAHQVDDQKYPPREFQYFINNAKEQGLRANKVEAYDDYRRYLVHIYELYEQQCQREGVVDFAELLLRSYELLKHNEALRTHYQQRFSHILIDEFQDTNDLQYAWLKLLAGSDTALFAVGDDDQSIYAFRGANVGNMQAFRRDFQVKHLIKLEQNYRSTGNILHSANLLIANNQQRLGKALHTDAGDGESIKVYAALSDTQEANWLAETIQELQQSTRLQQVAILYRSNAQSRVIEHALFSARISYRVYGGLRFFERAEIKHALAYLQLIAHPDHDAAFLRIVNFPARGIGTRTIEQLQELALTQQSSLYAAISLMAGRSGSSLTSFARLIEMLRETTRAMPLSQMIQAVLEHSGLITHYQNEKDGADRIENLEQLIYAAQAFLSEEGFAADHPALAGLQVTQHEPSLLNTEEFFSSDDSKDGFVINPLAAFLAHASLEAGEHQANAGEDALQLMTVHAAKGLEFDIVFITGLEEGLFPHEQSANDPNQLEEERRLMYVAITRARKKLYLSYSQTRMLHGQMRYALPSRFLEELPGNCLQWVASIPDRSDTYEDAYHSANSYGKRYGARYGQRQGVQAFQTPSQRESYTQESFRPKQIGQWQIGENVRHTKFGEGTILRLEGAEGQIRAQIRFTDCGVKLLDLNIARLEKLEQ